MIRVRKIAHATYEMPELDKQVEYYTDILGLTLTAREKDAVYLANTVDHHAIVLRRGPEDGRLWILLACRLDTVRRRLLVECVEIVVRSDLKTDAHAFHSLKLLLCGFGPLEHLHDRTLRILECDHLGDAEAEHIAIELCNVLHISHVKRQVTELVRYNALARRKLIDVEPRGIGEDERTRLHHLVELPEWSIGSPSSKGPSMLGLFGGVIGPLQSGQPELGNAYSQNSETPTRAPPHG